MKRARVGVRRIGSAGQDLGGAPLPHFALDCAVETEAPRAGSLARAFASGSHRRDAILNMRELVPLLAARSVDLKDQSSKLAPFRLPTWLLGPMMGVAPKLLTSVRVVLDSHSNMEELRSTCRDVLTEARRLGVNLPRLEAASSLFERTGQEQHADLADVVAQPACPPRAACI